MCLSAERGLAELKPRHRLQRRWNAPPEQMKGHQRPVESAGAEKLNGCLSASLSPLNYSSADGAPETTALEGSQRRAGGILRRCREFKGKKMGVSQKHLSASQLKLQRIRASL